MKMRFILERPSGVLEDIEVVADPGARVHDLARSVVRDDPQREYRGEDYKGDLALEVRATDGSGDVETFDSRDIIEDLTLASGVQLRIVPQATAPRSQAALLTVLAGPEEGVSTVVYRGTSTIGRDPSCDIVLADATVSKVHARIHATADKIELVDLNSANGVMVGDALVPRADISDGIEVRLGSTIFTAQITADAEPPSTRIQEKVYTRPPRVESRFAAHELEGADLPSPSEKQPFPWLMVMMPAVAGAAMFFITRSPLSLIFIAMSPLMMLGNFMTTSGRSKKSLKKSIERFEAQMERLSARLDKERVTETEVRFAEAPSLADVNAAVKDVRAPMWTRRPEHWAFMFLRLGVGTAPSRVSVKQPSNRDRALPEFEERFDAVVNKYRDIPQVPIVEDFTEAGALGIAGRMEYTAAYARGLIAQIAGLHSPTEVVVLGLCGPRWAQELEDLKWLPHAAAAESLVGVPFGASPQGAANVLAALEEIVSQRGKGKDAPAPLGALHENASALRVGARIGSENTPGSGYNAPLPAIVALISDDAPADRARMIQLVEKAAQRGVYPIWLADSETSLPAACRTFVTFDAKGSAAAHYVRLGTVISPMDVEVFRPEHMKRFALAASRVVDAAAISEDLSDLPSSVSLLDLIGRELATEPAAVVDRWEQNGSLILTPGTTSPGYAPRLRALVGQAAQGALHLDLRTQGPHALVGGTTGAGKSEFLQGWVLGMAAEYSPQRVTFLFVDYKGGSAFADCIELPHCVGLVTDLSPHLVRRALVSLRAELHYREELFNRKKAKDILDLEKRGDPECPPALVLVIDEFAALVNEVPDFVDGVVDIAQRGRSLGIHLIMATQRPAGVIKDNLRANTNLRVALRMADESDSMDVIGEKTSAQFPPELPGRASLKSGPGRLTVFQSAYTGGRSFDAPAEAMPEVASFAFGPPSQWERPEQKKPVDDGPVSPSDQQRLVRTIVASAQQARLAAPRRPWLDELPEVCALDQYLGGSDTAIPLGLRDVPQRQQQLPMYFEPDSDQNLAIFGAGGSGKSATLRTIATAAGYVTDGAVHVYGLDCGGSGLKMLDSLPHVGAVVAGDDPERVMRMMKMLRAEVERRTVAFGAVDASTLTEYRGIANKPAEPRLLLLVDNFPTFRGDYEGVSGRADAFATLQYIMAEGRSVGVHAVLTADRGPSISNSMQSSIQKRVVLRLADSDGYSVLGAPRDVLTPESPAGRGVFDGSECQIAVLGAIANVRDMSTALKESATTIPAAARDHAPEVGSLPSEYSIGELPSDVDELPVAGLSDVALGPHGFDPSGMILIAGGPESGRSTALLSLAQAMRRWRRDSLLYYLGARKSPLREWSGWNGAEQDAALFDGLDQVIDKAAAKGIPVGLFLEFAPDFSDTPSEMALLKWMKRARMGDFLVVAEGETNDFTGFSSVKAELKNARRGIVLQPETADGDTIMKTSFPRVAKTEFGPGRGLWVASGKSCRMQIPLPLAGDDPSVAPAKAVPGVSELISAKAAAGTEGSSASDDSDVPDWARAPGR